MLEKAKDYYETFERLKYNEDFVEFKKVVDREMERLSESILTSTDKDQAHIDIQVYKKLKILFDVWFDNAEKEAKQMRKKISKRKATRKD